jgi:predicted DNA binding protein
MSALLNRAFSLTSITDSDEILTGSLTDAEFSPHSPLSRLTEKQQKVFVTAYTLGYYDLPRRISLAQLAEELNLARSTLGAHLRKAERQLMYHIMNGS